MNAFIDSVYNGLIARGHTDATITPKLVFEAMRDETARLTQSGVGYQNFPSIFARDSADLERIEKAIGARLVSIDVGKSMVQSLWRELTFFYSPSVQNTEWLAQELDLGFRQRRGPVTAETVAEQLMTVRDNLRLRESKHPHLSAMSDLDIRALATHAFAHVREHKRATLLLEVTATIESIWRFGTTLDQPVTPAPRMEWVASRMGGATKDYGEPPHRSLALMATAGLDAEAVATYVQRGLHHEPNLHRNTLFAQAPERRAAFFARMRDANNVFFTQSCIELGERIAAATKVAHRPAAERVAPYRGLNTQQFVQGLSNADTTRAFDTARAALPTAVDSVSNCMMSEELAKADGLISGFGSNDFYVRLPVGEYGEKLASALLQAVEITSEAARKLGAEIADDMHHRDARGAIADTTLLKDFSKILVEGVVSIGQTLALLLAKKPAPPHDGMDAALKLIDESRLVTQVAAMAPFGVLAPMANFGLVPGHPIAVVEKRSGLRAQIPEGLEEILHAVQASRVEHLHRGNLGVWASSDHANETGRGCPVAGRGPVLGADGKLTMSKDAGLSVLTHEFIELTRKLLANAAA